MRSIRHFDAMVLFALGCLDLFPRRDVLNVLRLLFIQWQSYQLTCLGKIDFLKVDHAHSAIVLGVVVQHPVFRVVAGGRRAGSLGRGNGPDETRWRGVIAG